MGVVVGAGVVTTGGFVGTGVGYTRSALMGAGTAGGALTTLLGRGRGCVAVSVGNEMALCMAMVGCGVMQELV